MATSAVATAAPPTVNEKSCTAQGGTFTRDHGTKSCTTVGTPYTVVGPTQSGTAGPYTGTYHEEVTKQDTTTQTQKGNGDVTTTTTTQVLRREVVPETCFQTVLFVTIPAPTSDCAAAGVYPSA